MTRLVRDVKASPLIHNIVLQNYFSNFQLLHVTIMTVKVPYLNSNPFNFCYCLKIFIVKKREIWKANFETLWLEHALSFWLENA